MRMAFMFRIWHRLGGPQTWHVQKPRLFLSPLRGRQTMPGHPYPAVRSSAGSTPRTATRRCLPPTPPHCNHVARPLPLPAPDGFRPTSGPHGGPGFPASDHRAPAAAFLPRNSRAIPTGWLRDILKWSVEKKNGKNVARNMFFFWPPTPRKAVFLSPK